MLEAIIIGGANGSGKTTFARQFLPVLYPDAAFLNADEIQSEGDHFAHPVSAGREFLRRLDALEESRRSFAIEITLASRKYAERVRRWQAHGYLTTLHFIELPSAECAVQRVAERVAAGGHGVPESDIRRRFKRGLELYAAIYKPLVDSWYHWISDDRGLSLVGYHEED